MLKIIVMAALPQEYATFKRITGPWQTLETRPFKKLSCFLPNKEIVLIETGMGAHFAVDALATVLASRPDLVIFSGFAGGLHPDLAVGEVCVAETTLMLDPDCTETGSNAIGFRFPHELSAYFASKNIRPVTAVTVSKPPDKKALSALTPGVLSVVDMETADLVRIACNERLPLFCLRAVSDALNDELGFDLAEITGKVGKVDLFKVLRTIIRNPSVLGAFYRSWLRSRKAGKGLGYVLADFIRIPAPDLYRIASGIRILG